MNRRNFALLALLLTLCAAFGQATKKVPASPIASSAPVAPKIDGETTIAKARAAVLKMSGTESFKIYLETYALALPIHDAVLLCKELLSKAPASQRADLAAFAGSLALVAGRCEDAATLFSQGAESRPDLGIKAIRCFLAAGNFIEAKKQLDLMSGSSSAQGKSYEAPRQLALSWLYLLDGEPEKAFLLLQPLAEGASMAGSASSAGGASIAGEATRREALFLLWMIASSPDFAGFKASTQGFDAKSLEARLQAQFEGSIELGIIRKGIVMKPTSWLLTGIYASPDNASAERSMTQPPSPQGAAGTDSSSADSVSASAKLQVGWFSRKENAQALTTKLVKLGFAAKIDEQISDDGQPRWAVTVDASGDWSKTQARLKDQGYESYLLP